MVKCILNQNNSDSSLLTTVSIDKFEEAYFDSLNN